MNQQEITSLLQREADAILHIPVNEQYDRAIDLIVERIHHK
ncbi:MAG TPA: iron dicitrate transport regulator FecR, partial [Porphyromonadaceae bacterium]|nr:iron dicitrate transport regulator FecR [Porphyromonadaceae bacterium]